MDNENDYGYIPDEPDDDLEESFPYKEPDTMPAVRLKDKRDDGFLGVLSMQFMLVITLVIVVLFIKLVLPSSYGKIKQEYIAAMKTSTDFKKDYKRVKSKLAQMLDSPDGEAKKESSTPKEEQSSKTESSSESTEGTSSDAGNGAENAEESTEGQSTEGQPQPESESQGNA